jgi:hypothetical protein
VLTDSIDKQEKPHVPFCAAMLSEVAINVSHRTLGIAQRLHQLRFVA